MQLGGLPPLLELLESKHYNLQHNAAFALYGKSGAGRAGGRVECGRVGCGGWGQGDRETGQGAQRTGRLNYKCVRGHPLVDPLPVMYSVPGLAGWACFPSIPLTLWFGLV